MQQTNTPLPPAAQALPGPRFAVAGLTCLRPMRQDYLGFIGAVQSQHPDIAAWRVGWERMVHVFHPDWMRQVLVDQSDGWIRWERATDNFAQSMGQNVLVTEGAVWQRQRRMMLAGFTPKRVAAYAHHMVSACDEALQTLTTSVNEQPLDVQALMTHITMDVIVRTLFGHANAIDSARVSTAIRELSAEGYAQLFRPWNLPMWWPSAGMRRARAARDFLNALIAAQIETRRRALGQGSVDETQVSDLLAMLLLAQDPENPGQGLSTQEVHDQTMVMFQAGHETSATALTWWAGLVARHPEVLARLQTEVDTVLQGAPPTSERLQQMPWLQASLKEAMRLYPPAALLMTRRTLRDLDCGPWKIAKGSLVTITPALIQRDPRWFAEPDHFKPERFLPGAPEFPRSAWLPFGTGPRVCLGQHFAMLEMGVIAALLLQRFSLHWPTQQPWPEREVHITLQPKTPMKLVFRARPFNGRGN
nr:cytochrome P450 [uncultured Rhodoferax sp.]